MKTTTNCVAPEEVMAFLDGELTEFEAQVVSAHLDQCPECAGLAEEFRQTSRMLSEWRVPATSAKLDEFAIALAEKAGSRGAVRWNRASAAASRPNGNSKFWAIGGVGLLVASVLLVVSLSSFSRRNMMAPRSPALDNSRLSSTSAAALTALDAEASSRPAYQTARAQLRQSYAKVSVPGPVAASAPPTTAAPTIARTVSLSLVVKNVGVSRSTVDGILARHHGYTAQLNVQNSANSSPNVLASLRIPARDLDAALAELRSMGRVQAETQLGEEVTQQHVDLVARLKNSREAEDRLQAILHQRTGSVSDVLRVEQEIARVRGEIEGMEADQKVLENRVDFATVELQLMEEYKAQLNAPADSVSTRMHNAFVAGYRHASGTLLGIVLFFEEFGPVLLIWVVLLGLPLVLVWRRYRRAY